MSSNQTNGIHKHSKSLKSCVDCALGLYAMPIFSIIKTKKNVLHSVEFIPTKEAWAIYHCEMACRLFVSPLCSMRLSDNV